MNATPRDNVILLAHGGGGSLTRQLVEDVILRELKNPVLDRLDDSACLTVPETDLVMTTDSYVVDPLVFPGGDIGRLAVCGTVNDLAMQGGEPRHLSLALIIEEGLPVRDLERIIRSVAQAAQETGVSIVTGDTKVVENRGRDSRAGGLFINTAGLGVRRPGTDVAVSNAVPGDAVIVTGSLGDHGMAVMIRREGLEMGSSLTSDVAPLWSLVKPLLDGGGGAVHCLRDPTRGGVAAAACDIAEASGCAIRLRETALPVRDPVRGACDLLGMDPLNVANEGKAVVVCEDQTAGRILDALRSHPLGRDAALIGRVVPAPAGRVLLETIAGGERIVDVPTGEDLPRIC